MRAKIDIRSLTDEAIIEFCLKNNLKKFRAKQIIEWLWKKRATSFSQMSSLPVNVREMLSRHFNILPVTVHKSEKSIDNTIKYSLKLYDALLVEGVLIPSKDRITACISSQAGCSLSCNFCATGTLKLKRNLDASEIYDQVFILNEESISKFGKPLSNIVFMGMGEPLLNYKNLIEGVKLITTEKGLAISPKRITISTAGIAKMIKKLADEMLRINLAISLHSTNNEKRNDLMPLNEKINLDELKEAVKYYYNKTKNRITYEYLLLKDINDNIDDARSLVAFAKSIPCKINLIEYNMVEGISYEKSLKNNVVKFINYLESKNIIVNLRKSRGEDINAACGQLVNKLN